MAPATRNRARDQPAKGCTTAKRSVETQLGAEDASNNHKKQRRDKHEQSTSLVSSVKGTTAKDDGQTVFQTAIRCLASFRAQAEEYEALNSKDNKVQKPAKLQWDQDRNDLEALNRGAMGAAFRILNGIVMPRTSASAVVVDGGDNLKEKVVGGGGGESDVDALASELLLEARAKPGDVTWGTIAQGYLRALSGVAELLVEEKQSSSSSSVGTPNTSKMGALKYVEELQKKKQSDVMRFLLRVRCWELRQLNVIHRASRPSRPDKARRLGYKAKQGYVIYRVRVRRGGRKRPVPKGATYGKPTNQGVNQLKYQRSLKATAEERVGRRCANLRVLNSYWINQDSTYKYYEVILVDPQHKAIRIDPRINWIVNPVHKHRECRGLTATGKKSRGLNKGHRYNKTRAGRRKTWKRHNTLSLWRYR
ncbi:hypothetical protein L249_2222 [Ophiocordyceps polyrhachis-furcata BCC 54312]|uniref:Ribosomal protein L15 n=1 Tax=Ophiocordyceps polyrhachis-furcata BCC 54312 TaxID=1330021 RepID=A0A367LMV3_9HYPO|nr:hypothetical protein L249_2222 [Ophiocordyceps polyrhachis-furcata BCC 54312]